MKGFGSTTLFFLIIMQASHALASYGIVIPSEVNSFNNDAAFPYEPPSDLITAEVQRGLHVLFQRELEHYEFDENNHDISGNYEEVNSYLWLLGYLNIKPVDTNGKARWHWPRVYGRASDIEVPDAAFLEFALTYGVTGSLVKAKMQSCSVGNSNSVLDGDNVSSTVCKALFSSLERWFKNRNLVPASGEYSSVPRVIGWKRYYRERVRKECWSRPYNCSEYWASDTGTYTDLPKKQIRKLNAAVEEENWSRLTALAVKSTNQHFLYSYYAGLGLVRQGLFNDAEPHWISFLEQSGYQYPKFSANAATVLIGNFYGQGKDQKVISTGQHFDLKQFKKDFSESRLSISVTVGQIQYFSSLSLIEKPRIATALRGFIELKGDQLVASNVEIQAMVDEQLQSLLQQISEVGSANTSLFATESSVFQFAAKSED